MPKSLSLNLHTFDQRVELEFDKATIYTGKYRAKLVPGAIHVPSAAKIIYTHGNKISAIIAELPVVIVDAEGNTTVHTQSSFDLVTLRNVGEFKKRYPKDVLERELSSIRAKKVFGISQEEVVREQSVTTKLAMHTVIDRLRRPREGGGFDA